MLKLAELFEKAKKGEISWKVIGAFYSKKRIKWVKRNRARIKALIKELKKKGYSECQVAYYLFIRKYLGINEKRSQVIHSRKNKIIWHSYNPCEVIELCKRESLNTRFICKEVFEKPVNDFIQAIGLNVNFGRNYDKIRPHAKYCEEYFELKKPKRS